MSGRSQRALRLWADRDRFLRCLDRTQSVDQACTAAGVTRHEAYYARRKFPLFKEAWARVYLYHRLNTCDSCACMVCAKLTDCPVHRPRSRCNTLCTEKYDNDNTHNVLIPIMVRPTWKGKMRDESTTEERAKKLCKHFEMHRPLSADRSARWGGRPSPMAKCQEYVDPMLVKAEQPTRKLGKYG